jgi:hypothetical protein
LLLNAVLAVSIFIVGYITIQWIVKKIKTRIETNNLEETIYIKRTSGLVGKFIFIFLMIFLILAVFQVI